MEGAPINCPSPKRSAAATYWIKLRIPDCMLDIPYALKWAGGCPPKIAPSPGGDLGPQLKHMVPLA